MRVCGYCEPTFVLFPYITWGSDQPILWYMYATWFLTASDHRVVPLLCDAIRTRFYLNLNTIFRIRQSGEVLSVILHVFHVRFF